MLQDIVKDNANVFQAYIAFNGANKSNFNTDIKENGEVEVMDLDKAGIVVAERGWFKKAIEKDGFVYAEPYVDEFSSSTVTTSIPI